MYDNLFYDTALVCPKCESQNINILNKMLICEVCGWYHVAVTEKPIIKRTYTKRKPTKRRALRRDTRLPMSEFMLNDNNK